MPGPVQGNDPAAYLKALMGLPVRGPAPGTSLGMPPPPPQPQAKGASFIGAAKSSALDTAAGVARIVGADDTANALAKQSMEAAPGGEGLGDFMTNLAGSAAPSIATITAATIGGFALGGPVGAGAGFIGSSATLNAAGSAEYQYKEGIDASRGEWIAPMLANTGIDILTGMSIGSTLRKVGQQAVVDKAMKETAESGAGQVAERIWKKTSTRIAAGATGGAAYEAAQGAAQSYIDITTAKMFIGLDTKTLRPEDKQFLLESMAGRGTLGGIHGAIRGFVNKHGIDPRTATDEQLTKIMENIEKDFDAKALAEDNAAARLANNQQGMPAIDNAISGEFLGREGIPYIPVQEDAAVKGVGMDAERYLMGELDDTDIGGTPLLGRVAQDTPRSQEPEVGVIDQFPLTDPARLLEDISQSPGKKIWDDATAGVVEPPPQRKYIYQDATYEKIHKQMLGLETAKSKIAIILKPFMQDFAEFSQDPRFTKQLIEDVILETRKRKAISPEQMLSIIDKNVKKFAVEKPQVKTSEVLVNSTGKVSRGPEVMKDLPESQDIPLLKEKVKTRIEGIEEKITTLEEALASRPGSRSPMEDIKKSPHDRLQGRHGETENTKGYTDKAFYDGDNVVKIARKSKKNVIVAVDRHVRDTFRRQVYEPAIAMATDVFNKYFPGDKLVIHLSEDKEIGQMGHYVAYKDGDKTVHQIVVNTKSILEQDIRRYAEKNGLSASNETAIHIMALRDMLFHELGHAIDVKYLRDLAPAELGKLVKEWQDHTQRWVNEGYLDLKEKKGDAMGFINLHVNMAKITDEGLKVPHDLTDKSARREFSYYTSFSEFLANRFMEEMIARGEGKPTMSNKVFAVLQHWWNALSSLYDTMLKSYNRSTSFADIVSLIQERNELRREKGQVTPNAEGYQFLIDKDLWGSVTPDTRMRSGMNRETAYFEDKANESFKENEIKGLNEYTDILAKGYNLFHKVTLTPLQMAAKYGLPQIKKYMAYVEQWAVYKNKLQEVPEQLLLAWGKQSTAMREQMAEFSFHIAEESKKADRRFTPDEQQALATKFGLGDDQIKLWQEVDKTFQARLDHMEKAEIYGAVKPYVEKPMDFLKELYAAEGKAAKIDVMHKYLGSTPIMDKEGNFTGLARDMLTQKLETVSADYSKYRKYHYFPQSRFGKFFVKYTAAGDMEYKGKQFKKGDTVLFMTAENRRDHKAMIDEGAKLMHGKDVVSDISAFSDLQQSIMNMPQSLLTSILENDNLELTPKQQQEVRQMASDMTMDRSFTKHFKQKRGVDGYSRDALRVYSDYMLKSANHVSRMMFGDDMQKSLKELDMGIRQTQGIDTTNIRGVYDYFGEHLSYIMKPENDFAAARSMAFHWYLGFNVKAAAVNLTQVPMVALPVISGRHGMKNAVKFVTASMSDVTNWLVNGKGLTQQEMEMMVRLGHDGLIDESIAQNMANYANHNFIEQYLPINDINPKLGRLGQYSGALFQMGEKFNRRVSGLSAFRAELARTGDKEKAYEYAKSVIRNSQFENSVWNKGQFQRGKLGVVTVFYSYVQNMMHLMTNFDTPENAKTARNMWGMLLVMGGAQGLPFAEWLLDMLDLGGTKFKETFGMSNPRVDSRLAMREFMEDFAPGSSDWLMHGISRHFFGADISGSIGMGTPLPWLRGTEASASPNEKVGQQFQNFAGATLGIPIAMYKALNSTNPDEFRNMMSAMPTAAKNLYKGYEIASNDAILSPSGGKFYDYDGMGGVAGFFQAAGFTSTSLAQKYEQFGAQLESKAYWQGMRHEMLNEYYLAKQEGDRTRINDVREAVRRYNRGVRVAGLGRLTIDGESLSGAVRNRERVAELRLRGESAQRAYDSLFRDIKKAYPVSGEE